MLANSGGVFGKAPPKQLDTRNSDTGVLLDLQGLAEDIRKLRDLRDQIVSGRHAFYKASGAVPLSASAVQADTPTSTLLERITSTEGKQSPKQGASSIEAQLPSLAETNPQDLSARLARFNRPGSKLPELHGKHETTGSTLSTAGRTRVLPRTRSNDRDSQKNDKREDVRTHSSYRYSEDADSRRHSKIPSTAPPYPQKSFHDYRTEHPTPNHDRSPPRARANPKRRRSPSPALSAGATFKSRSPDRQHREDRVTKQRRSPSASDSAGLSSHGVTSAGAYDSCRNTFGEQRFHQIELPNLNPSSLSIRGPPGMSVRISRTNPQESHSQAPGMAHSAPLANQSLQILPASTASQQQSFDTYAVSNGFPRSYLADTDTYGPREVVDSKILLRRSSEWSSQRYQPQNLTNASVSSSIAQPVSAVPQFPANDSSPRTPRDTAVPHGFRSDMTNSYTTPLGAPVVPDSSASADYWTGSDGFSEPYRQTGANGSWPHDNQEWHSSQHTPSSWQVNSYGQALSRQSFQQTAYPYAPSRQTSRNSAVVAGQRQGPDSQYTQHNTQDPRTWFHGAYQGYP